MENIVEEPALSFNFISEEEYLERERKATEKHEYYRGEIFAMSGASLRHNRIFYRYWEQVKRKRMSAIW